MNTYITRLTDGSQQNAGSKAPRDVNQICSMLEWQRFDMKVVSNPIGRIISLLYQWIKLGQTNSEYILLQHPMYGGTKIARYMIPVIQKRFGCKIIVLIHDLESLRFHKSYDEIKMICSCSYVICHNKKMEEYLLSQGVEPENVSELEIFDYLCDKTAECTRDARKSIAIAGNLSRQKCEYIYKLIKENPTIKVDLYGVGYEGNPKFINVEYHGSYDPEELPAKLESAYGLVWDGGEITTCSGDYGEYLKYNNPHKLSLYMAAGMPVITWRQAAIADFVERNQVGILVDSLVDLSQTLNRISDEQYEIMCRNANAIGQKVRSGFYLRNAIGEIVWHI